MSVGIGRVFGVKIKIHYTWFIIFALITWTLAAFYLPTQFPGLTTPIYWILGVISAVLLFVSVLVHELAHSYVAIKRGIPVSSITLFLFGGVSETESEPSDPKTEASMSVVGPLTSFAISGISAAAWYATVVLNLGAAVEAPLFYIAIINLLLGGFNLLPAFPLDGGRLLRAGLWSWKKDLILATKLATRISTFFAYGIMGIGLFSILFVNLISGLWIIFIGWFLKNGADQSLRQTMITQALSDINVKEIMSKNVVTVPDEKTISEVVAEYFDVNKHGGYPVIQDDKIVGIITVEDIRKVPKEERSAKKVSEIMTPRSKLVFLRPNESATDAFVKFSKNEIGRLPVIENEKVVGIITRSDLLRIVRTRTRLEA